MKATVTTTVEEVTNPGEATKETRRVKNYGSKADKLTEEILSEPIGTFRSSWARSLETELKRAARKNKEDDGDSRDDVIRSDNVDEDVIIREDDTPDIWEDRLMEEPLLKNTKRKTTPTIRRPAVEKEWFGLVTSTDESEEEKGNWTEVERKKKERK